MASCLGTLNTKRGGHSAPPQTLNPYNMDNIKVTLTPTELGDIIDRAFKLGKMYAADELDTTDVQTPAFRDPQDWDNWIQSHGGQTLNAGDAKLDILWESCAMKMREELKDAIEY